MFCVYWILNHKEILYILVAAVLTSTPLVWVSRLISSILQSRATARTGVGATLVITVSLFLMTCFDNRGSVGVSINSLYGISYTVPANLAISLDTLSTPFFLVTLLLGCVAITFSQFYMEGEVYKTRFTQLLTSFLLSMLLLITANNFVTLFLGWELIGLFSFLLINFWTIKATGIKSANKALAYNQLSDAFFMLMVVGYYSNGSDLCPDSVTTNAVAVNSTVTTLALVGCICCKSAQFPLHFWLPDSMEAPIPASALIHSATLVSAGVYLILRLEAYHMFNSTLVKILTAVSTLTILVGGVASCIQTDLKKILAYSTIANCGFMVLFATLNKSALCFMYFTLHGVFKAAAFFIVGTVVIVSHHKQDWRCANLPLGQRAQITYLLLPTVALLGAWPGTVTGFIKHLNVNLAASLQLSEAVIWVAWIGASTSIIYSVKIILLVTQYDNIKNQNSVKETTHVLQQLTQIVLMLVIALATIVCYYYKNELNSLAVGTSLVNYVPNFSQALAGTTVLLIPVVFKFWTKLNGPGLSYLVCAALIAVQTI